MADHYVQCDCGHSEVDYEAREWEDETLCHSCYNARVTPDMELDADLQWVLENDNS